MPQSSFPRQRVGYLINQYPKVSHTFIRREIRALEQLGVEVERFALRGWADPVADPEDEKERARTRHTLREGISALVFSAIKFLLNHPRTFWNAFGAALRMSRRSLRPWPYHLIYLGHACRIMEYLKETPVQHLHAHFGTNSAEVALLVRRLGGPPFSFTIHGRGEIDGAKQLHLAQKVREASFVVAVSSFTRSQLLREISPRDWEKVQVVHCGLADDSFSSSPPPPPVEPTFLSIGRLSPEKAHLILLPAFAAVLKTAPQARLVIAGDGEMRPAIEAKIAGLGLGEAVDITGWIDTPQVRKELTKAHVLVQPSFIEGLPVVIMEAFALGRPVISTYVGGIPELVRPGENGWLVPAGNIEALAQAMLESIASEPERLDEMGRAGQASVRSEHHIDNEARKLCAFYFGKTPC